MCGKFLLPDDRESLSMQALLATLRQRYGYELPADRMLIPGQLVPSYTAGGHMPLRWGVTFRQKQGLLTHLRAETALEKPFFRRALLGGGRCLIPAAAYFEWTMREAKKQRCRFSPPTAQPLYLAGVFLPGPSPDAPPQMALLTTAANASVQPFHHRMPLILPAERCRAYLRDPAQLESLLRSVPAPLQPAL